MIADRAAGNPFFAEEMVRESGRSAVCCTARGSYVCRTDITDVTVPATVQAAIEARIDRLSASAKRTLNAASVIGARFGPSCSPRLASIRRSTSCSRRALDQVRFTPRAEYAFRHPLIRAVAYESQLKSDRAEWHRRLAVASRSATRSRPRRTRR